MARHLSFLDLPLHIRQKIYTSVGLVRICPIDMLTEGERRRAREIYINNTLDPNDRTHIDRINCLFFRRERGSIDPLRDVDYPHEFDCNCPSLPTQLFYICRQISNDVIPFFYGRNNFKIIRRAQGDLEVFRKLSPVALRSIESLHVSLDPDDEDSQLDSSVVGEWLSFCSFARSSMRPASLNLGLSCQAIHHAAAEEIFEPLKNWNLAHCAISLDKRPAFSAWSSNSNPYVRALRQTVKEAVLQASASRTPTSPFHFNRLPFELRRLILCHTDLVLKQASEGFPRRELLIWNGRLGGSPLCGAPRVPLCCGACTHSLHTCCCYYQPAAFSTTCVCYQVPTGMFTVSRQFSVEALDVFYLENRFVFMDGMEKTMGFLNRLSPGLQQKLKMVSLSLHFTDVEDFSEVPNHVFPQILHSFIIQCLRESFGLAEVWPAIDRGPLCEDDFLFKDTSVSFKGGRRDKYNVVLEPTRQLYGPKRYYISVIL